MDTLESFDSFDELDIPGRLADNLRDMNFSVPTPVQAKTILPALDGRDILGIAQTGTGKTAAFGIPLLSTIYPDPEKQALILAPTRELAAQIHRVFKQMTQGMKLYGALLVGGESFHRQVSELDQGVDYIIATPGRLNDHLEQKTVRLNRVNILVLDELDRMLDMGFLPQVRQVLKHVPENRQTLLFSATLPPDISKLVDSLLYKPVKVKIEPVNLPEEKPNIEEQTIETTPEGKNSIILKEIDNRQGKILVFTRTKSRCDRLALMLERKGQRVVRLHGGRSQGQRKEALDKFRTGRCRIMVATDLAGRGIDVADIEHVINYDVPSTREDYIHRIGRTGRAGKTGIALNLLTAGDFEGERVVKGIKATPRVVFSSRRFGRRR